MAEPANTTVHSDSQQTVQPLLLPHLSMELRHRIGALQIDADFELTRRWTVLFGPSGSGKSTILRAMAGTFVPDRAKIVSFPSSGTNRRTGFTVVDSNANLFVPARRRAMPMAPQHPTLFPNLTVLANIRYSQHNARDRENGAPNISELLSQFHLAPLADKRPADLSGGEAQRVNLARAVASGGWRLLLLDEPFTGLDAELKATLIAYLMDLQREERYGPILSVTHDVAEAFQLRAEIIKIAEGRIVAEGYVESVLAEERERLLRQLQ